MFFDTRIVSVSNLRFVNGPLVSRSRQNAITRSEINIVAQHLLDERNELYRLMSRD